MIVIIFLFTGCDVIDPNGLTRNLNASLKPLVINSIDFIYPFLGFIGLIMLALSIYTMFIKPHNPNETVVNYLISGTFEFLIAIALITSKDLVKYWMGS
jgi:hypothetical protein